MEKYAALHSINVQEWNSNFNKDMRRAFKKENSSFRKKTRMLQKLIKDTAGTNKEEVVYVTIRGSAPRLQKSE